MYSKELFCLGVSGAINEDTLVSASIFSSLVGTGDSRPFVTNDSFAVRRLHDP